MPGRVVLVIVEGLNYQVALNCMGYLRGLEKMGRCLRKKLLCETPGLSRPLYETILTGVHPIDSGILNNDVIRLSTQTSIFSLAHAQGLTTAAAAYHWISELYNRAPFEPLRDRFTHNASMPIQHGIFYWQDHYPDDHLYAEAEYLRIQYHPDFLLVLSMNVDDAGHHQGLDSKKYRDATRKVDSILSNYIPRWLEDDYQVLITADHGMNTDCTHGGTLPEEREVPLFAIGNAFNESSPPDVRQLELCGLVCDLLGIKNHGKPSAAPHLCRGFLQ